ncbi:MAG: peptidoglycan editing factor PgeF [Rhizobacter sp.]|nr:peptidoglycan editing factor PgeF [Rhizobacter sp.]
MTTRAGGCSAAPWDSLNLGTAVGDEPAHVALNRSRFEQAMGAAPIYLKQVHGTRVVRLTHDQVGAPLQEADASVTSSPGLACVVQVADCLPVLLAAPGAVGAAHAGWRGLAGGVIEATVRALCELSGCAPAQVECWLGACIGPEAFEVGADVLEGFGVQPAGADPQRFRPLRPGKWLANLPQLARDRLAAAGVEQVSGGSWCTVQDRSRFFSFRRDGVTGRMAAGIWRV